MPLFRMSKLSGEQPTTEDFKLLFQLICKYGEDILITYIDWTRLEFAE